MRESNFAFPAQNKACVCITSQLYDRRALDTTSPLPLFNSLTHLTYLTSTSPRIREIMTMDGGLERLVRILHDFCLSPPPPENPTLLYGLMPPSARPPKPIPQLNPHSYDKHAAYRFSLAFQCVVNIGVRGSEEIRRRVVQAGTLDVVGCILEAWLASKGFAVGPSSSATGLPRETREQRQARRNAALEQRQREEASALARALQRQIQVEQLTQRAQREHVRWQLRTAGAIEGLPVNGDDSMDVSPAGGSTQSLAQLNDDAGPSASNSDTELSANNSTTITPLGGSTPTGTVVVPGRDRSGTIIARTIWDAVPTTTAPVIPGTAPVTRAQPQPRIIIEMGQIQDPEQPSPAASTDNSRPSSRPETETEDDGDVEMESTDTGPSHRGRSGPSRLETDIASASASASPSPERPPHPRLPPTIGHGRRAVGIVSDTPDATVGNLNLGMPLTGDAHIIINDAGVGEDGTVGVGVEDGIVSLEQNDDFAMGAPPGAPGAMEGATPRGLNTGIDTGRRRNPAAQDAPDVTPRAGVISLPPSAGPTPPQLPSPIAGFIPQAPLGHQRNATIRGRLDNGLLQLPRAVHGPGGTQPAPVTPGGATTPGGPINIARRPSVTVVIPTTAATAAAQAAAATGAAAGPSHHHHHRHAHGDVETGPYRDEDVLLSLQLLAYLSKYPHVRQAFYKPRVTFHPASVNLPGGRYTTVNNKGPATEPQPPASPAKEQKQGFYQTFGPPNLTSLLSARAKEKSASSASGASATSTPTTSTLPGSSTSSTTTAAPVRQTNVFSLVERFTFKPSSTETDLPNPPPRLPPEIQYWAGVIMRNACRKDDSRGGIRQCANMLCGRWESYPREFAKCRRCRKAKYCGKECQSTAWSEGHRFWCSARDGDEDGEHHHSSSTTQPGGAANQQADQDVEASAEEGTMNSHTTATTQPGPSTARAERRERHARERERDRDRATQLMAQAQQQQQRLQQQLAAAQHHAHMLPPAVGPDPTGTLRPGFRPMGMPPHHIQPQTTIPGPIGGIAGHSMPPNAPFIPPGVLSLDASPSGGGANVSRQSSTSTVRMRPRVVVPPMPGNGETPSPMDTSSPAPSSTLTYHQQLHQHQQQMFGQRSPFSEAGPSSGSGSGSASTSAIIPSPTSPVNATSPVASITAAATRRRMENTSAYRVIPQPPPHVIAGEDRDMVLG